MNIFSVRGAITIEENTKECIVNNSQLLLNEVLVQNNINKNDIINIIFSATKDITKAYPAISTRNLGITDCPIMCLQELFVEDSLPMCIRLMITFNSKKNKSEIKHIYLKDAKKLRPDISLKDNPISITIDGPAGTGKSTISKIIAKELNFKYIDTGAMFRAVAYYYLTNNIDLNDNNEILKHLDKIHLSFKFENGAQISYLNGINIDKYIRTEKVSATSSIIAKIPKIREFLLNIQRNIAKNENVIMEGRDAGTNILPNANVKIFLDAKLDIRAKRRFDQLNLNSLHELQNIKNEIQIRDENDENRILSPLKKADDAIYLDTSQMSINSVVEEIIKIIKQNIK